MQTMRMAVIHHRDRNIKNLRPETTTDLPPEQERENGKTHHRVAKLAGYAIGKALNRRLPGLGLLHQINDPCQGRFTTNSLHLDDQGGLEVETSGTELSAWRSIERQRFPSQAGEIHSRMPLTHDSIHWNAIAGQQLSSVPEVSTSRPP